MFILGGRSSLSILWAVVLEYDPGCTECTCALAVTCNEDVTPDMCWGLDAPKGSDVGFYQSDVMCTDGWKEETDFFFLKDGSFPFCSFCVFPPLSSPGTGDAESWAFPLWEYRIHLPQTPAAQKRMCARKCVCVRHSPVVWERACIQWRNDRERGRGRGERGRE